MEPLYLNNFSERADVIREFSNYGWDYETNTSREGNPDIGDNVEILIADYTYEDYYGSAWVLFRDTNNGKLYEVHGSHCSCYGLEDQWSPEEANIDAVLMRYQNEQDDLPVKIKLNEIKSCA